MFDLVILISSLLNPNIESVWHQLLVFMYSFLKHHFFPNLFFFTFSNFFKIQVYFSTFLAKVLSKKLNKLFLNGHTMSKHSSFFLHHKHGDFLKSQMPRDIALLKTMVFIFSPQKLIHSKTCVNYTCDICNMFYISPHFPKLQHNP